LSAPVVHDNKIAVIGLGYVGLPLAIRLSKFFQVYGFDVNEVRVNELRSGFDRTAECKSSDLDQTNWQISSSIEDITDCDIYIVTVPTPVNEDNSPDLSSVLSASAGVGKVLGPGNIVVFESTVYPGVTEDICGPAIETASGLTCGQDFYLGYSPERINPGDREHTVDKITKIVAGQTSAVTDQLADIYGAITKGGVFKAKNIRTAEAAKVIENAQRDINIAFINEVSMIFNRMGIQTHDVLEAASTKWNFLDFKPGLVGGHCIGVDPFYLAHAARHAGHNPAVILAGRRINDGFAIFIANQIHDALGTSGHANILVLGLTFKENVPDLRNSKVAHLIAALKEKGHTVSVHDPLADRDEAHSEYDIDLISDLDKTIKHDCVIGAVAHLQYQGFKESDFEPLLNSGGLLADLKGMWRNVELGGDYRRWEL
jgi:UDP-N-acetyl-D-galactosamine dehydrogenase